MIGELSETRRRRGSVQLVGADTASMIAFPETSVSKSRYAGHSQGVACVYVRGVAFCVADQAP